MNRWFLLPLVVSASSAFGAGAAPHPTQSKILSLALPDAYRVTNPEGVRQAVAELRAEVPRVLPRGTNCRLLEVFEMGDTGDLMDFSAGLSSRWRQEYAPLKSSYRPVSRGGLRMNEEITKSLTTVYKTGSAKPFAYVFSSSERLFLGETLAANAMSVTVCAP